MKKDQKTKEALSSTLILMLKRLPLDDISITALCKTAKVSRTAFYSNFHTKDDVLLYIYRQNHTLVFKDKFKESSYLLSDDFIKDMISFFDRNSDLLEVIYHWDLIDIITRFNTRISLDLATNYPTTITDGSEDYFTLFISSSIFNVCLYWVLKKKDLTPEELFKKIKYYLKMMAKG